jgi:hypothetical protein
VSEEDYLSLPVSGAARFCMDQSQKLFTEHFKTGDIRAAAFRFSVTTVVYPDYIETGIVKSLREIPVSAAVFGIAMGDENGGWNMPLAFFFDEPFSYPSGSSVRTLKGCYNFRHMHLLLSIIRPHTRFVKKRKSFKI